MSHAWPKWRAIAHHFDIASTGIHRAPPNSGGH